MIHREHGLSLDLGRIAQELRNSLGVEVIDHVHGFALFGGTQGKNIETRGFQAIAYAIKVSLEALEDLSRSGKLPTRSVEKRGRFPDGVLLRAKRRRVRTHARVELIKGPAQLRECVLGRLADLIRGSLAVLSGLRQRLAGGVEGVESSLRRAGDILQALHQLFIGGVALVERIDCALDCLLIRAIERVGLQQGVQPTNDLIRLVDDVLRRSRRGIRTGNCALQIAGHRANRGIGVTGALYQGGTAL